MPEVARRLTQLIISFLGWWRGELSALVPQRLRLLFLPSRKVLVLEPSDHRVVLRLFRGQKCRTLGEVQRGDEKLIALRLAIGRLIRKINLRRTEIALRLPTKESLNRTIVLPWLAESEVRSALLFQIDRFTPYSTEDVCFDYRISARDPESKRLTVELTMIPRSVVESNLTLAEAWGLRPDIVDVLDDRPDAPPRLNLLSDAPAPGASKALRMLNAALATTAVILLALAIYVPVNEKGVEAKALAALVGEVKSKAHEVAALRDEVERLQGEVGFLSGEKRRAPSHVQVIDALTRSLPDDTWLNEFTIEGRETSIVGYSDGASRLIGEIDASPRFQTPRFLSPVVQDARLGLERFFVSFEIEQNGSDQ